MSTDARELLRRCAEGDESAARELVESHTRRLLGLVRRRLSPTVARRTDAEDVVQSTYRSFFRRAAANAFDVHEEADLWRLLASIARHKLSRHVERHRAAKRSVEREIGSAPDAFTDEDSVTVAELADELAALGIDDRERRVLELRLEDRSTEEIAAEVGCSERTVRRVLARMERRLEHRWGLRRRSTVAESANRSRMPSDAMDIADLLLHRMVGRGGAGRVYRATHRPSGATVAVKFLHKSLWDQPGLVGRFREEMRLLSRLRHPGIVGWRGNGELASGLPFVVTEWHAAGDLESRVGRCTVREAAAWTGDVAEAVAFAHEAGVVHCDLKPANVLLAADGRAVVGDFGHAVLHRAGGDVPGGTAAYLAPELRHDPKAPAAPAVDVYGLGALLFALVEGRPPGPSPKFVDAAWTPDLSELCGRCLSGRVDDRPSAASVGRELPRTGGATA